MIRISCGIENYVGLNFLLVLKTINWNRFKVKLAFKFDGNKYEKY